MWAAYVRLLRAKPVRANFVTAAVVTCAGDAIAQRIEARQHDGHHPEPEREPDPEPEFRHDAERSATVTAYWAGTSPALYYWFRHLDARFPTTAAAAAGRPVTLLPRLLTLAKKIVVHQWSFVPLCNGSFFAYLTCVRHHLHGEGSATLEAALQDVPARTWEAQQTSVGALTPPSLARLRTASLNPGCDGPVVWGVAHTFNFLLLPPHTRVLFNSCVGVLWNAYMSLVGHRPEEAT